MKTVNTGHTYSLWQKIHISMSEQKSPFNYKNYNPGQLIWNKVKKSSKVGQD